MSTITKARGPWTFLAALVAAAGLTVAGGLTVTGGVSSDDLTASDDLVVGDDADVVADLTAGTITSDAGVTATTTVTGADVAATDDLTVGDDATITGDLAVTGAAGTFCRAISTAFTYQSGTLTIGTVPAGKHWVVDAAWVLTNVQFDGTSPTIKSGTSGAASDDGFLPASAGSTTALKAALPGGFGLDANERGASLWDTDHERLHIAAAGDVVSLVVAPDGSTAGAGTHVLHYCEIPAIYAP
jgi:hypothetical protein